MIVYWRMHASVVLNELNNVLSRDENTYLHSWRRLVNIPGFTTDPAITEQAGFYIQEGHIGE